MLLKVETQYRLEEQQPTSTNLISFSNEFNKQKTLILLDKVGHLTGGFVLFRSQVKDEMTGEEVRADEVEIQVASRIVHLLKITKQPVILAYNRWVCGEEMLPGGLQESVSRYLEVINSISE